MKPIQRYSLWAGGVALIGALSLYTGYKLQVRKMPQEVHLIGATSGQAMLVKTPKKYLLIVNSHSTESEEELAKYLRRRDLVVGSQVILLDNTQEVMTQSRTLDTYLKDSILEAGGGRLELRDMTYCFLSQVVSNPYTLLEAIEQSYILRGTFEQIQIGIETQKINPEQLLMCIIDEPKALTSAQITWLREQNERMGVVETVESGTIVIYESGKSYEMTSDYLLGIDIL